MRLARVEGNIVATRKHSSLDGWRMVVCQPINLEGDDDGTPIIAIDPYGAGMHQRVIVTSDGSAARKAVGDNSSPVRMMITGIIDRMEEEKKA
ncbi:MAG: EutN/CcmL family microcompartment protein [Verrucomicrobiota bacterium]|jgi:microcompartment protein CcmK/EutM|nr:EutN/CcmL family microcompartment protein [Verrucomicrobiota bacterium]|tara:strand:+ start:708 stop:986 length:279 start_codon:yes stop_codon:yes gene_type:complete